MNWHLVKCTLEGFGCCVLYAGTTCLLITGASSDVKAFKYAARTVLILILLSIVGLVSYIVGSVLCR